VAFDELKEKLSVVWGSAPWELIAGQMAPLHEHIVRALAPEPGDRWLDVGTGTGAVAVIAARAGADVTGVDLAPGMIATARRLAAEEGLPVRYEVGDAEALPVPDASFDEVSSAMGLIFAPDHAAAASELARVCAPGGRIGFTAWRENACFFPLMRRYSPPLLPGQGDAVDWGREEYCERMLGESFDIEFEEGEAPVTGESGEAVWELMLRGSGPLQARYTSLDDDQRDALHGEFVDLLESHRIDGGIELPARYLLVLGTRR
jgi:SAM-dependent methyltransferase